MITTTKESQASSNQFTPRKKNSWKSQQKELEINHSYSPISKNSFTQQIKDMSLEERYLSMKIHVPGLYRAIRENIRKNEINLWDQGQFHMKTNFTKNHKSILDVVVFLSDGREFLDNISFDSIYIENPEKLYDLLTISNEITVDYNIIQQKHRTPKSWKEILKQVEQADSCQQLSVVLSDIVKEEILYKSYKRFRLNIEQQKNRKKELNLYWKKLLPEHRKNMLYLDQQDIKQLVHYLVDRNIHLTPKQLELEITQLLLLENNQFYNKILKCKINKISSTHDYYELVYQNWKQLVNLIKSTKTHKNKKHHLERTTSYNLHHDKYKNKSKKNKSISAESNETTQTENKQLQQTIQQQPTNVTQIIIDKINEDLIDYCDNLSHQSNKLQPRRIIAFQRLQEVLKLYGIPVKLFGSCANGIALANSDVDIAIDSSILGYFMAQGESQRLKMALAWLQQILKGHPWVKMIKLITTASIPLIKMTVDTSKVMIDPTGMNYNYQKLLYLNRSHECGELQIDITIETKDKNSCCNHLGIISTTTIQNWLQQIQTLQQIIIILKHYFANKQLNIVYQGGLNAYSMIVLIVAFVYHSKLQKEIKVAEVFKQFLKFYCEKFDESKSIIDIRNKDQIFITKGVQQQNDKKYAELQIRDPLNNGKVVTRNCYLFPKVKQLFGEIYDHCFKRPQLKIQHLISSMNPKQKRSNEFQQEIEQCKKHLPNHFETLLS